MEILFILSTVFCSLFFIAAVIFFILWFVAKSRDKVLLRCQRCSAPLDLNAQFCPRCGAKIVPGNTPKSKKGRPFLILAIVFLVCAVLSIFGIVIGASNSETTTSSAVVGAVNLDSDVTSSGWDISFDRVGSGYIKKNSHIDADSSKKLHIMSRVESGLVSVYASQGDQVLEYAIPDGSDEGTLDLSTFNEGKISIKVTFENAHDGNVLIWLE